MISCRRLRLGVGNAEGIAAALNAHRITLWHIHFVHGPYAAIINSLPCVHPVVFGAESHGLLQLSVPANLHRDANRAILAAIPPGLHRFIGDLALGWCVYTHFWPCGDGIHPLPLTVHPRHGGQEGFKHIVFAILLCAHGGNQVYTRSKIIKDDLAPRIGFGSLVSRDAIGKNIGVQSDGHFIPLALRGGAGDLDGV